VLSVAHGHDFSAVVTSDLYRHGFDAAVGAEDEKALPGPYAQVDPQGDEEGQPDRRQRPGGNEVEVRRSWAQSPTVDGDDVREGARRVPAGAR